MSSDATSTSYDLLSMDFVLPIRSIPLEPSARETTEKLMSNQVAAANAGSVLSLSGAFWFFIGHLSGVAALTLAHYAP